MIRIFNYYLSFPVLNDVWLKELVFERCVDNIYPVYVNTSDEN